MLEERLVNIEQKLPFRKPDRGTEQNGYQQRTKLDRLEAIANRW